MKSFKNLLIVAGTLCAVVSATSAHALVTRNNVVTGCVAVYTGGEEQTFWTPTRVNYYDVYCGSSNKKSDADRKNEINKKIQAQINKDADNGWSYLHRDLKTYENAVKACKNSLNAKEFSGKYRDRCN